MVQSIEPSAFACRATRPEDVEVDLLFVPVFEQDDRLTDLAGLDEASGGEIARARSTGEFRAKLYDVFITPVTGKGWKALRIALGSVDCTIRAPLSSRNPHGRRSETR